MLLKQCQIILLILITFGGIKISAAQDTLRLSLNDALKMAQENNLNIRNSQLDLKMAQKKIWETTAIGLPHADVKSTYQHIFVIPTLSFPGAELSNTEVPFDKNTGFGTTSKVALSNGENIYLNSIAGIQYELGIKDNITTDFSVSQLIFNGAYLIGLKASKVYYDFSAESLVKVQLEMNESVTNTYYMILVAEESRKVLISNLKNVNKTFEEIRETYKQGLVEKTDVDQLEITANSITNAISQIGNNLDMAQRLLKIQLGLNDNATVTLTDQLGMDDAQVTKLTALAKETFVLENSIDFKLLKTSELLAKYDYKKEMTNSLPVIAAFYNHQEKWKSPSIDFTPKDVVGINFTLPIFSSGQRSATVAQKRMAYEKATNNKLYMTNTLLMQSMQLQNDLRTKLEKFQIQKKSKDLSDVIYQRTLEKYKQGISSSMELMTIQNQYLASLTDYYQGIYDVVGARTKLEKLFNINQNISK